MTANFCFVTDAAQADPHKLAVHRAGDRAPKAGLADAGRSSQAEDLRDADTFDLVQQAKFAHGQKVENAFLDVLQAVVIVVEDLLGDFDIEPVLALPGPGETGHGVQVGADHSRLG